MMKLIISLMFCCIATVATSQTMQSVALRDHIAVDVGVWLPFGDVVPRLDLKPSVGFNIHFWKAFSDNWFVIGSVGNGWMNLGSAVQTDSGIQDYSAYILTVSPLLGGAGYVLSFGEVVSSYVAVHAGASIINISEGARQPIPYLQNNAYFTVGGTIGLAYRLSEGVSLLTNARYLKMFGEDLQHVDASVGASFRW